MWNSHQNRIDWPLLVVHSNLFRLLYIYIYRYLATDGWPAGRTDGRTDGRAGGCTEVRRYAGTEVRMYGCTDKHGHTDGRTDEQIGPLATVNVSC